MSADKWRRSCGFDALIWCAEPLHQIHYDHTESHMSFATWTPEMSVSNTKMDAQHQRLIDIINRYHEALEAQAPHAQLQKIFDEVIAFASQHFRDEEALMERADYPNLSRHRLMHQNLTQRVLEFQKALKDEKPGAEREIQYFLKSWLTAHILGIDKLYAPFIRKAA